MEELIKSLEEVIEALKKVKSSVEEMTLTIDISDIGKQITEYQKANCDNNAKALEKQ